MKFYTLSIIIMMSLIPFAYGLLSDEYAVGIYYDNWSLAYKASVRDLGGSGANWYTWDGSQGIDSTWTLKNGTEYHFVVWGTNDPTGADRMAYDSLSNGAHHVGYAIHWDWDQLISSPAGLGAQFSIYVGLEPTETPVGDGCDPSVSGAWFVSGGCTITSAEFAGVLQRGDEVHLLVGDGDIGLV